MKDNAIFYTASMAKLCAGQGYYDKSIEIFRYLLESDPDNEAFQTLLAEVEAQKAATATVSGNALKGLDRLEPMIKKWVELMVEHDLKSKFDKIRKNVNDFKSPNSEI